MDENNDKTKQIIDLTPQPKKSKIEDELDLDFSF
jgi:hypothetical protein